MKTSTPAADSFFSFFFLSYLFCLSVLFFLFVLSSLLSSSSSLSFLTLPNYFQGNIGEACKRRSGMHPGFPELLDTTLIQLCCYVPVRAVRKCEDTRFQVPVFTSLKLPLSCYPTEAAYLSGDTVRSDPFLKPMIDVRRENLIDGNRVSSSLMTSR